MDISFENVSKVYRKGAKALDDVSLHIPSGVFGLLGPNGAGKSTLMKIAATLIEATSGRIKVGGFELPKEQHEVRRILGYLPQEFGLFNNLTAYEMMDYVAIMKGMQDNVKRRAEIERLLEWVNLTDVHKRRVGSFSGGMKQRLAIAQALLNEPKLLILDEPTAGLDPEERMRFRNLLNRISADRVVILSTHIVSDVAAGCQRLAVLNRGRIMLQGEVEDLKRCAEGMVWEAEVPSHTDIEALPDAVTVSSRRDGDRLYLRLLAKQPPLADARPADPGLEDGYMALITGMNGGDAR
ncbi:ABC transporter ATP-binding protein [Mahella sp.]|uniref:ABC transporter ATP-binding protein n=1 Tax=Mahella sp. TaxID=2798721 RepID=UPI0025C659FA|nr:ABC transporter ATP-binding protein [Mahella sp.]MBZ4664844.1 transporter related protein [Mahella sp.]